MSRSCLWSAALLVSLAWAAAAAAADITGSIEVEEQGTVLRAIEDVAVYFRPDQAVVPPVPEQSFEMAARDKAFSPAVLVIPVGAQVSFPNRDPILHNVFSLSRGNEFDVGLYGPGDGESTVFAQPGLVRVYCNVHQHMVGHVLVLDTPFFTMAGADGSFSLESVPDGPGRLYVWHERARPLVIPLEAVPVEPLELQLSLTRRQVPEHRNKFGKPYRRTRDRGRY